ncbi:DUF4169 family protein [Sphingomonas kyungheensis]|uniref:DUF4169 family protein n=1 Tax=Sphingomonas kyungheensis TaxID=1069987 RepID=A0ABU8H5L8_9SPHN
MAEIINLRTARKAAARAAADRTAAANRARFGRTKSERAADDADRARVDRIVDGAKLED